MIVSRKKVGSGHGRRYRQPSQVNKYGEISTGDWYLMGRNDDTYLKETSYQSYDLIFLFRFGLFASKRPVRNLIFVSNL